MKPGWERGDPPLDLLKADQAAPGTAWGPAILRFQPESEIVGGRGDQVSWFHAPRGGKDPSPLPRRAKGEGGVVIPLEFSETVKPLSLGITFPPSV